MASAPHAGVLKTPYGTLVADRELLAGVYLDPDARYSVCGQFERMSHLAREQGANAGTRNEQEDFA